MGRSAPHTTNLPKTPVMRTMEGRHRRLRQTGTQAIRPDAIGSLAGKLSINASSRSSSARDLELGNVSRAISTNSGIVSTPSRISSIGWGNLFSMCRYSVLRSIKRVRSSMYWTILRHPYAIPSTPRASAAAGPSARKREVPHRRLVSGSLGVGEPSILQFS